MVSPGHATAAPPASPNRPLLWAGRLAVLAAFLDLFAQLPVVGPYARDLGASSATIGVVVATYSIANLLGNLGAVAVMDRWGRRVSLVVGFLGAAAALTLYSRAPSATELIGLRAVHGLAAGLLTPGAFALLGDAAPAGQRARAMGSGGALIAGAAVVGPPLAGLGRDRLGAEAVFLTTAAVLALAAVVIGALARDRGSRPAGHASASGQADTRLSRSALLAACLAAFAVTIGLGTLITHLPLLLEARQEPARSSGLSFAAFAVVALLAMAGPASRLGDRFGRQRPLAAGLAVLGAGLVALAAAPSLLAVQAAMGLFGLGFGLFFPSATALVADASGPARRGAAFGIFYAIYSLGSIVGSLASGGLAEVLGVTSAAPFVLGGGCALVAAPAVLATRRPRPGHASG